MSESSGSSIRAEYERRFTSAQAETTALSRRDRVVANLRLALFAIAIVFAWLAWGPALVSGWLLIAPISVFVVVIFRHDRVIKELEMARRRTSLYEKAIERVNDRWAGAGVPGTRFADPAHPYAVDLDLFGRASLFELLCTARTRAGEETLAAWLLNPAAPPIIEARQQAVRDLAPRLDLREEIALLGDSVRSTADPAVLSAWGMELPNPFSHAIRIAALVISVLSGASVIAWFSGYGYVPLIVMAGIGRVFDSPVSRRVKAIVQAISKPARDLELLALILGRLEREEFDAPLLRGLLSNMDSPAGHPSRRIARLMTLVDYLRSRENPAFAPFAFLLLWAHQFAFAIEAWRAENGKFITEWLRVLGEFEALSSLAGYTYEHPDGVFPVIVEAHGSARVEADQIAHLLLPSSHSVPNDVRLDDSVRALVLSGSNMSGKSTLLRTLGINVVLAQAGGPVRARSFRFTPLSVGASIRTQDSLEGGVSRFYAEIKRLRQIVEIADTKPPALFLLDEILHGTNSHDRLIGAEAVVRALLAKGAIGLVTTHDLALARISEDLSLQVANVHFQDEIRDGKMFFDYHLRPGVVERSNAIELMRAVGLPV